MAPGDWRNDDIFNSIGCSFCFENYHFPITILKQFCRLTLSNLNIVGCGLPLNLNPNNYEIISYIHDYKIREIKLKNASKFKKC